MSKPMYVVRTRIVEQDGGQRWIDIGKVWLNESGTLSGGIDVLPIGHVGALAIVVAKVPWLKDGK